MKYTKISDVKQALSIPPRTWARIGRGLTSREDIQALKSQTVKTAVHTKM